MSELKANYEDQLDQVREQAIQDKERSLAEQKRQLELMFTEEKELMRL